MDSESNVRLHLGILDDVLGILAATKGRGWTPKTLDIFFQTVGAIIDDNMDPLADKEKLKRQADNMKTIATGIMASLQKVITHWEEGHVICVLKAIGSSYNINYRTQ